MLGAIPWKVRATLDRRSLSTIAIIASVELTTYEVLQLKQIAFERLNLGRSIS